VHVFHGSLIEAVLPETVSACATPPTVFTKTYGADVIPLGIVT
jgi:hypothetical protein